MFLNVVIEICRVKGCPSAHMPIQDVAHMGRCRGPRNLNGWVIMLLILPVHMGLCVARGAPPGREFIFGGVEFMGRQFVPKRQRFISALFISYFQRLLRM